jgi:hypothetical protein
VIRLTVTAEIPEGARAWAQRVANGAQRLSLYAVVAAALVEGLVSSIELRHARKVLARHGG